jgi:hypothetical protein
VCVPNWIRMVVLAAWCRLEEWGFPAA